MKITVISKKTGLITIGPDLVVQYIGQTMNGKKIGKFTFKIGINTTYDVDMKENYLHVEDKGWMDENGYIDEGLSEILTRSIRG